MTEIHRDTKVTNSLRNALVTGTFKFFTCKIRLLAIALFTILLGFLVEYSTLWWLAYVVGVFCGLLIEKGRIAFIIGFACLFTSWALHMALIAFFEDLRALDFIFSLIQLNVGWLVLITMVLGGLLGGFGALNGTLLRQMVKETKWYKVRENIHP